MLVRRFAGFLGVSVLAFTVSAEPTNQLAINSLESRLERLERLVNTQTVLEQESQRAQYQREIQSLRGEIEVLTHHLELVKKQQQDIYLDIDQRLRQLQTLQPAPVEPLPSKTPTTPPVTSTATTPPVAVVPPPKETVATPPKVATVTPPQPIQAVMPTLPTTNNGDEQTYQKAFKALQEGQYDKANVGFEELLKNYPQSTYADNAQYWLGESNYALKKFSAALAAFNTLREKYPNSSKQAHALLKIGFTYYEMKDRIAARAILEQVKNTYPNTATARLAEERLQKINAEDH